jgi:hypothetical protein
MCLHPFDQKKLPCQDFVYLSCVFFWHQRVFNSNNLGAWPRILHSIQEGPPLPFPRETCPAAWLQQHQGLAYGNNFLDL